MSNKEMLLKVKEFFKNTKHYDNLRVLRYSSDSLELHIRAKDGKHLLSCELRCYFRDTFNPDSDLVFLTYLDDDNDEDRLYSITSSCTLSTLDEGIIDLLEYIISRSDLIQHDAENHKNMAIKGLENLGIEYEDSGES